MLRESRFPIAAAALAAVALVAPAPSRAEEETTWHGSLADGLSAAKKSGRPLLVVTIWKPDV